MWSNFEYRWPWSCLLGWSLIATRFWDTLPPIIALVQSHFYIQMWNPSISKWTRSSKCCLSRNQSLDFQTSIYEQVNVELHWLRSSLNIVNAQWIQFSSACDLLLSMSSTFWKDSIEDPDSQIMADKKNMEETSQVLKKNTAITTFKHAVRMKGHGVYACALCSNDLAEIAVRKLQG